ncbi:chemosensory receptor C [Elysia marginata]|uniref:Chemosensory receptor C n=1 Tax=Elysia marginata TaxID=1093978 RepID=A0AAV4IJ64_9GAST|nr:chemosensory receptor C [Elysia marginata]
MAITVESTTIAPINTTTGVSFNEVNGDPNISVSTNIGYGDAYDARVKHYLDLYMNIVFVFILTLFALGTNLINMIVLVKQGVQSCVSLCLLFLAATDFLSTFAGFVSIVSKILMYRNQRPGFDPSAVYYLMVFLSATFYDVSNKLTAFLSLERCLCVSLPFKFKDIFTTKVTIAVIFCVYLLCFGLMMPHFLSSGLRMRTVGNSTYLALWLSPDRAAVNAYVDFMHFCQTIVVLAVVLVCTLRMLLSLQHSSKFQKGNSKGAELTTQSTSSTGAKSTELTNSLPSKSEKDESEVAVEHVNNTQNNLRSSKTGTLQKAAHPQAPNLKSSETTTGRANPKGGNQAIKRDKTSQSTRNLNVMKTVIMLSVICFTCNVSRVVAASATHVEPKLQFGKEYNDWFQLMAALCYIFQLLNCSLNLFVYYTYNQSFRAAFKQMFLCKPST